MSWSIKLALDGTVVCVCVAHRTRVHPSPSITAKTTTRLDSDSRRPLDDNSERAGRTYAWGYHSEPCHYFAFLLYLLVSVSGSVSALNGVRFAKFSPIRSLTVLLPYGPEEPTGFISINLQFRR